MPQLVAPVCGTAETLACSFRTASPLVSGPATIASRCANLLQQIWNDRTKLDELCRKDVYIHCKQKFNELKNAAEAGTREIQELTLIELAYVANGNDNPEEMPRPILYFKESFESDDPAAGHNDEKWEMFFYDAMTDKKFTRGEFEEKLGIKWYAKMVELNGVFREPVMRIIEPPKNIVVASVADAAFLLKLIPEGKGDFNARRVKDGVPHPHSGLDWYCDCGTPVTVSMDGRVTSIRADDPMKNGKPVNAAGRLVLVDHGKGFTTMTMHLKRVDVDVGDKVAVGDQIGLAGFSGNARNSTFKNPKYATEEDPVGNTHAHVYYMRYGTKFDPTNDGGKNLFLKGDLRAPIDTRGLVVWDVSFDSAGKSSYTIAASFDGAGRIIA